MSDPWTEPSQPESVHGPNPPAAPPTPDNTAAHTMSLPTYERPEAPAPARRSAALPAAVLVGAMVLGGAAGVGGSVAYDVWKGQSQPTATKSEPSAPQAPVELPADATNVEKVAAKVLPSVVQINVVGQSGGGTGSGVIIKADGVILTNNHVVDAAGNGGTVTVNFHDGRSATAKVLGTDPVTDLAVIKAGGVSGLPVAAIGDSAALRVGQPVVAFGSPYGLESTVTTGIVSALNRAVSVATAEQADPTDPFGGNTASSTTYPAIQTDAAINPGNSGGPLVNLSGEVIGINSSIRTASAGAEGGQGGSIGLGFAIPINAIMPIADQLAAGQSATHARLGIAVGNNAEGEKVASGALVKTVEAGSAAEAAGLKVGDVIISVDNRLTPTADSLVATVRSYRPDDRVKVTFLRAGATQSVSATLGSDAQKKAS